MSLRRHTPLLLGLVFAIFISLFPFNTIVVQGAGDSLVELPGSVSPELGSPAPVPSNLTKADLYRVAVTLRPRNEAAYAALATAIQDVKSSYYRRFITAAEYAQYFAPSQQSMDNLKKYLTGQGLGVVYESADRLLLTVEGTISQLDKAFSTSSEYRTNSKGQSGYINVTSLKLPASLAATIVGVTGFDTLHTPHVHSVRQPIGGGSGIIASTPITSFNTPTSERTAYGISGSGYTGLGANVGITLWGAPNQTDLGRWQTNQDVGHPITLTVIGSSTPTTDDNLRFEANMDVQMVHVGAFNANIRFYNAPTNSFADLQSALSSAVNDNVNALTNSWGACESGISSGTRNGYHTVFQSAATKGIPVFFSSGDSGVFECNSFGSVTSVGFSSFPSGDDLVTSVGGTTLSRDGTTNAWFNENGWSCNAGNDVTCLQSFGGSSGGGKTVNYTRPTYQSGITPPTEAKFTNSASNTRVEPDLSMNGDPATGIIIYGTYGSCNDNCLGGGTSASSPLMAGSLAQAFERKGSQVGGINSFIYTNFSGAPWGFDVISGYNGVTDKVGWDYVNGLGSLKNVGSFVSAFVTLCDTVVTKNTDDGSCGTLRAAVSSANTGATKTVTFTLSLPTTITLTGSGLTVGPGVTIGSLATTCTAGVPLVTISGQGVAGDGLTISSSTLIGLYVRQFGGRQIVTGAPGNILSCVKASKT